MNGHQPGHESRGYPCDAGGRPQAGAQNQERSSKNKTQKDACNIRIHIWFYCWFHDQHPALFFLGFSGTGDAGTADGDSVGAEGEDTGGEAGS